MQFSTLTAVLNPALASTVIADNCRAGYNYCGSDLIHKGNYKFTIQQELSSKGVDQNNNHNVQDSLFLCKIDGWIAYLQTCGGGCNWLGDGKEGNDWC
ncbi:uncharacterized protein RSE6_13031 [Rhynchosporium secalis]|uniref:Uncharacterized protein n=1 Tax=Rhynchosporium secalis TaxID=38038 RepID=A0A1E1MRV5_RHYSE|nr:uncharacterized protein RSE6_13031 [Rhynchosporium secalis]